MTEDRASKETVPAADRRTTGASGSNGSNGSNGGRFGFHDRSFDQRFPVFTVEGTGLKPVQPDDQTPNVTAVLRDLLGWRPVPGDAKAFSAALAASFDLKQVEGHVESTYVPRGFAMQADLGTVTGGQASLYARARAGLTHMLMLLDGLTPLDPAFDRENTEATRSLVRNELTRIVDELGAPGGPRQALVDSSFFILLGTDVVPVPPPLPDDVGGQLGALRNGFGLLADRVNTVEEERIRTSFWTLSDEVQDLARAWDTWKEFLVDDDVAGFLGTDFVLISRLMAAASEQVDEFESVLDSVLVGAAERQTIELDDTGLTLEGLLSWTRRFLREDGRTYLTYSGRIGLEQAFQPTSERLVETYRETLISALGLPSNGFSTSGTGGGTPSIKLQLPPGLFAARVSIALQALFQQLEQLHQLATDAAFGSESAEVIDRGEEIDTDPEPEAGLAGVGGVGGVAGVGGNPLTAQLADPVGGETVAAEPAATGTLGVSGVTLRDATRARTREIAESKDDRRVQISAQLVNPPGDVTLVLVLLTPDGAVIKPAERLPRVGDEVSAIFNFSVTRRPELAKLRWRGDDVQRPVDEIPLQIRDLQTGEVLFDSPAVDWSNVVIPEPDGTPAWLDDAEDSL